MTANGLLPNRGVYYRIPTVPMEYPITHVDTTLLTNGNLLRVAGTKWQKVEYRSGRWMLQGSYVARFAEGIIWLNLDAGGFPRRVRIVERNKINTNYVIFDIEWRCESFMQVNGYRIPKHIVHRWKRPYAQSEDLSTIQLLQVRRMKEAPKPKFAMEL